MPRDWRESSVLERWERFRSEIDGVGGKGPQITPVRERRDRLTHVRTPQGLSAGGGGRGGGGLEGLGVLLAGVFDELFEVVVQLHLEAGEPLLKLVSVEAGERVLEAGLD